MDRKRALTTGITGQTPTGWTADIALTDGLARTYQWLLDRHAAGRA